MDLDFTSEKGYQKFIIAIIGMAGTVLVAIFGISPDKSNAIISAATIFAPMIATGLYYIVNQVAAAGKAKAEIAKIEATASAIVKTGVIPEVKVEEKQVNTEKVMVPVAIPFDELAFMAEVNKTITRYSVVNASTIFYNAEQVFRDWSFNNDQALKDAKALLLRLAGAAFKGIWGASYQDAWTYLNDPLGRGAPKSTAQLICTYPDLKYKAQQLGTGFYTALLDYERIAFIQ